MTVGVESDNYWLAESQYWRKNETTVIPILTFARIRRERQWKLYSHMFHDGCERPLTRFHYYSSISRSWISLPWESASCLVSSTTDNDIEIIVMIVWPIEAERVVPESCLLWWRYPQRHKNNVLTFQKTKVISLFVYEASIIEANLDGNGRQWNNWRQRTSG